MPDSSFFDSLARAFLAGEADAASIIGRAARMLGKQWRWIPQVARKYVRVFGGRVRPRHREVAEFLRSRQVPGWPKLSVERWITDSQQMRPVTAALFWGVPAIETIGALAEWLGLSPAALDWFADLKGLSLDGKVSHYHYRILEKQSGGSRIIEAPKPRLKAVQRLILGEIIEKIPTHPAAHGFCKGRSIQTFAAAHAGRRVVLRMDLEDFFPSVSGTRVQTLFRVAGYPAPVADLLGGICTNAVPRRFAPPSPYRRPHLAQGAPSSPALANLCAYRLDCRLAGLARAAGAQYTRYADDLAFSGDAGFERAVERFLLHAAAIAMEEGFAVNHRKTRVMRQGVRQHLAGLVTNRHVNVVRTDYDRLKATLTNCARWGPTGQNRAGHPHFREHLQGRVAFVESVNPGRGERLRALFNRIQWQ